MTLATWLAFCLATILLCFSPGPGALSSMSAGMKYGWRRGMWNCLGMQASIIVNSTIIALGLGAILMASTTAFDIMKWCGALYLMWLGIQKFREEPVPFEEIAARTEFKDTSTKGIFLQGFLVSQTNPKGLIFLLAVLPQFVDPSAADGDAVRDPDLDAGVRGYRRDGLLHRLCSAGADDAERPGSHSMDESGDREFVCGCGWGVGGV